MFSTKKSRFLSSKTINSRYNILTDKRLLAETHYTMYHIDAIGWQFDRPHIKGCILYCFNL